MSPLPQVIFLDAVGTLFGVRGTVGEVYGEIAQQFGVEVAPEAIEAAFIECFQRSPLAAFPGVSPAELAEYEFNWWRAIATQTFQQVGVFEQFADFSGFFTQLYDYFAIADPWFVYPDVVEALTGWQNQGIELGIISNFDSRIYSVLKALNLAEFFTSFTISTEVGVAKPDPQIFAIALAKHHCSASKAWHIGDSWKEDYQAATEAGLKAIWLNRDRQPDRGEVWYTLLG
ncbi:MAG: HAD-IA family hydrolase [Desertifilum sp. SIO1I2]|nr:HAD-IA family hydrolase [Desertifilum sp. SIO1I2]